MDGKAAAARVQEWLASERLEFKIVTDAQALIHLHVKYPPTKQGHVFNVVIPKNRNLVLVYSITRVDEGQQNEMKDHANEDSAEWEEWLHSTRLQLTRADLDWVLHVGKPADNSPGPLQAFNLSRPIWFDGLTQNEFMHTMRRVWLTKLELIHQIKFSYGKGIGKPGPVDDWIAKKAKQSRKSQSKESKSASIDTDETGSFGAEFDPDEWA
ncbi:MAG: DUF2299 family protein [Candidatus Thalassarchaeaceae archaeon]|mgnify:FL=1|nr:DUF2299 family protein [Candidatus Thalassarchaeaceae archaeon]MDP6318050.1 DUF2299 family protein [Candidatus Thalassarchaeaceae archaeon]HJN70852.1 DUF2299 family protein [Candidatus Thalassarchaeaceae archaeon]|tara:strand:- start:4609 stop:5241 length:633 start_codon:yes stop_codon:yes gene_type:complete